MCSLPAHNPCLPFTGYITGGINIGTRIIIRGFMPYHSDRFTIDLQTGGHYMHDDIAFHMSVRPSEYTIVRNSFQGCWGPEERYGSCPIQRGQSYDVEITTEFNRFIVRINGAHFCEFNHRLPIQRISHVHIGGETTLYYVGQEGGYPHCGGSVHPPPYQPVIINPAPVIVRKPNHHRPNHHRPNHHNPGVITGAAIVGGIIGAAAAAATSKPGCHQRPHYPHRPHHHHRKNC